MTGNRRPHDNSRNVTHSNHDRATATPRCVLDQRDATMVKPATREKQSIEISYDCMSGGWICCDTPA